MNENEIIMKWEKRFTREMSEITEETSEVTKEKGSSRKVVGLTETR